MAFAINRFRAGIQRVDGAGAIHGVQYVSIGITALAADVAVDISGLVAGSLSTFWTQALADTTYGSLAAQAQAKLAAISNSGVNLHAIKSEQLLSRFQVASAPSGTQYSIGVTNHLPVITFAAANGVTSLNLVLEFGIQSGQEGVSGSFG